MSAGIGPREMLDRWSPGEVLDINEEMTQFMLRVTSAILFGFDAPELTERIGHQIDEWVNGNHQTGMGAIVSDPQFTSNYDRLLELGERVEQALREMIDLRRPDAQHRNDVLSILIRERDAEGRVDDDTLIGHAALLFGAAHLTTAHSFTWTLFLLAQHPTIARQLFAEGHIVPGVSHGRRFPERNEARRTSVANGPAPRNISGRAVAGAAARASGASARGAGAC